MLSLPETVPARPLAAFRVVIGLVGMAKAVEYAVSPFRGTLPHPLLGFLPTLPVPVFTAVSAVMVVAATLVVLGRRPRLSALVLGLCVAWFLVVAGYYANHAYLLATLAVMLSFTECDPGRERVWAPPVYLLRAQITIVYAFAAIAKINPDFLTGNGLASWGFHSWLAPRSLLVMPLLPAMAVGTVLCELFVATMLWVPRVRPVACCVGVLLHLGMIVFISPNLLGVVELGMFAAMMIAGYLLFLDRLPAPLRRLGPDRRAAPAGRERAPAG